MPERPLARIALATCRDYPAPSTDAPLRDALLAAGHRIDSVPWDDDPRPFLDADLVVLRACWDYHARPQAFLDWLAVLEARGVSLENGYDLVRWNFDKRYLVDLADADVPTVPTCLLTTPNEEAIRSAMRERRWDRAVRKPVHGQSGHGVQLIDASQAVPAPDFDGPALLQAFQADITELGETPEVDLPRPFLDDFYWDDSKQYNFSVGPDGRVLTFLDFGGSELGREVRVDASWLGEGTALGGA